MGGSALPFGNRKNQPVTKQKRVKQTCKSKFHGRCTGEMNIASERERHRAVVVPRCTQLLRYASQLLRSPAASRKRRGGSIFVMKFAVVVNGIP